MSDQPVHIEKLSNVSDLENLNVGYWIKGRLTTEIEVGKRLVAWREVKNGVKAEGLFRTSQIQDVREWSKSDCSGVDVTTSNSVYRVKFITEDELTE